MYTLYVMTGRGGQDRYFFAKQSRPGSRAAGKIPAGYDVYENPRAQVFLRKIRPRKITDEEIDVVRVAMRRLASTPHVLVDAKDREIIVHAADDDDAPSEIARQLGFTIKSETAERLDRRAVQYAAMLKFELTDPTKRLFAVWRWCFLGSIDDWYLLEGDANLRHLAEKYAPHVGAESFFELD